MTEYDGFFNKLKSILSWVGGLLSVIGVVFVVIRLRGYISQIDLSRLYFSDWFFLICFSTLYAIINVTLALAWKQIIKFYGISLSFWKTTYIYGTSQLSKYVPGNIFHLAGRQALGMVAGVPGWVLAKSSIWELGLIAFAGSLFGLLALPLWWKDFPIIFSVLLFVSILFGVLYVSRRWIKSQIAWALGYQVLFLMISGLIFCGVLSLISPDSLTLDTLFSIAGAFVIAWLAGFVTPGAPAGVGVRELVLLFLMKGFVEESNLLLAVAIGRVVTVLGDFIFFLGAAFLKEKSKNNIEDNLV